MFLFVNVDEAVGIHISIPHIRGMVIYWHIFLIIAVSILMTIANNKTWTIDLVGKLLLLKCLTDLISFFFNINTAPEGYLGYYACSVTAFFSYVVFIQKPCMEKEYYKYCLLYAEIVVHLAAIYCHHLFSCRNLYGHGYLALMLNLSVKRSSCLCISLQKATASWWTGYDSITI